VESTEVTEDVLRSTTGHTRNQAWPVVGRSPPCASVPPRLRVKPCPPSPPSPPGWACSRASCVLWSGWSGARKPVSNT